MRSNILNRGRPQDLAHDGVQMNFPTSSMEREELFICEEVSSYNFVQFFRNVGSLTDAQSRTFFSLFLNYMQLNGKDVPLQLLKPELIFLNRDLQISFARLSDSTTSQFEQKACVESLIHFAGVVLFFIVTKEWNQPQQILERMDHLIFDNEFKDFFRTIFGRKHEDFKFLISHPWMLRYALSTKALQNSLKEYTQDYSQGKQNDSNRINDCGFRAEAYESAVPIHQKHSIQQEPFNGKFQQLRIEIGNAKCHSYCSPTASSNPVQSIIGFEVKSEGDKRKQIQNRENGKIFPKKVCRSLKSITFPARPAFIPEYEVTYTTQSSPRNILDKLEQIIGEMKGRVEKRKDEKCKLKATFQTSDLSLSQAVGLCVQLYGEDDLCVIHLQRRKGSTYDFHQLKRQLQDKFHAI